MKHIKMPKEIAEKWLAALRSGEYGQGRNRLQSGENSFCCLGVLQMVVDREVERDSDGESRGLPSYSWLKKNNISFYHELETMYRFPHCASKNENFASLNDSGYSFPEIADLLEQEIEYTEDK